MGIKYIYSVYDEYELKKYMAFLNKYSKKINRYIDYLRSNLNVIDIPQYIYFANFESATKGFRNIELPAYTNDIRMVITPEIDVWKEIYIKQLENYEESFEKDYIKNYYNNLGENSILQIIGHELAHHSEFFEESFDQDLETGIWFEEGMVEYISRKYFYTNKEYFQEKKSNQILVELFERKNGLNSIEYFGQETYKSSYDEIFYYYWKSFLAIDAIVERNGDVYKVFDLYKKWYKGERNLTLSEWFEI